MAEFEEKQYETAAAIELATGKEYGQVFSSGQVLEKILGYDTAADPDDAHPIWTILRAPRPPGIRLMPRFWLPGVEPPIDRLPRHPVSLIFQYKRPMYLSGPTAKQWHRWNQPYYRFERNNDQQVVLRRFERAVKANVVVRYAAPAFWRYADLEYHQLHGSVLSTSGFVAPAKLARHTVWTYQSPGAVGYPNPTGRGSMFETIDEILTQFVMPAVNAQLAVVDEFDRSLEDLASIALSRQPALSRAISAWTSSLLTFNVVRPETRRRLTSFAAVQSVLGRIGATWYMQEST